MPSIRQSIRSSTASKRPTSAIADGQIALNTASGTPGIFFKDNANNIIKAGPAHYGATAPNSSPATGGSTGNSIGEAWLDSSLTPAGWKIWNGSAWVNATPLSSDTVQGLVELATNAEVQAGADTARAVTAAGLQSKVSDSISTTSSSGIASSTAVKTAYDLANAALPKSGGIITGNLEIGSTGSFTFEGATADAFETTLAVVDPTADRTITFPDTTGTVVTTGDSGTVTSTMILDGTILNADINASAAIVDTKLATISTADKVSLSALNIDGGTDIGAALADVDLFIVDDGGAGTNRKAAATRITDYAFGKVSGDITIGSTGTAAISSGVIVNADVNASAAIDGTKISPGFGGQNTTTTGTSTAGSFIPTGGTAPTNGVYLPSANNVAISTNGTQRLAVDTAATTSTLPVVHPLGAVGTPSITFTGDLNTGIYSPAADTLAFVEGGAEAMRIDSSGRLLVGASSAFDTWTAATNYQFGIEQNAALSTLALKTNAASAGGAYVSFGKSRGTTANSKTVVQNGDALGGVYFEGADGTNMAPAASISAQVDGTPGTNDMPGRLVFSTTADGAASPTERLRITSAGLVGLGTSSPSSNLHVSAASSTAIKISETNNGVSGSLQAGSTSVSLGADTNHSLNFYTNAAERLRITSAGNVGIGTTAPAGKLHVNVASDTAAIFYSSGANMVNIAALNDAGSSSKQLVLDGSPLAFNIASVEKARIDSSGRLLVGTSSALPIGGSNHAVQNETTGASISATRHGGTTAGDGAVISLSRSRGTTSGSVTAVANGDALGYLQFCGSNGSDFSNYAAWIACEVDGTPFSGGDTTDLPGRLVFSTTADGAASPTERMRITQAGNLRIGQSTTDGPGIAGDNTVGTAIGSNGYVAASRDGNAALYVNRKTNDGDLVLFYQDATQEGTISVSGTTVSYNGAHLSRWSQLPGGATREEILRGTVLSNIDEMCGWGEEANEQLNRMKVSDVEGDKNVSGVFQAWDNDDDTYVDDFYCAMTGDFIIRIAEGVTVERGDLLMSAGDGTAKPQDDDIIRSKTVAKVTSTHITCTYEDGSYCVPCVLMAC